MLDNEMPHKNIVRLYYKHFSVCHRLSVKSSCLDSVIRNSFLNGTCHEQQVITLNPHLSNVERKREQLSHPPPPSAATDLPLRMALNTTSTSDYSSQHNPLAHACLMNSPESFHFLWKHTELYLHVNFVRQEFLTEIIIFFTYLNLCSVA